MKNNWMGRRMPASQGWPVMSLGAGVPWFWLAYGDYAPALLGATALVLAPILGIVWLSRARAARRFNAAMDAFAEQEMDRERRRNGPPMVRGSSPRGSALPAGSTHDW
jgi:hypothetical protein